ncbi:hypothetical protein [Yersinia phage PY54]|uniref:hypothetical protein n=1 Tax=Yersinia phage PY54 TaxID=172667 RepID=UPI00001B9861|nr:hypothetical protein PY54p52 [Yersinia phage PY54]EKN3944406.1 hypothetical protein [Yersinia enterocolitica]CAD91813.1 hypothetical protein [Yersinia phage PY54]
MLILMFTPGFSIKKGSFMGSDKPDMKMLSIRTPFGAIYWLSGKPTSVILDAARSSLNDPDWFIKNHYAVRQAKRRSSTTRHKEYLKAQDEAEKLYRSRIDELMNDKYQLEMKCREQARDILAYSRLVKGESDGTST